MISEKLKAAREYEKANAAKVPEAESPLFHARGAIGWINDPNGFSIYKGEYHLFFQYHPYSTFWGPMHWGHVKTKDFIKWEQLPIAIAPDSDFDARGCFSGSAIELPDGRQLLVYTGVSEGKDEKGNPVDYQQQCIAIGDGIDYEKCSLNPVIDTTMIPQGHNRYDFRDPKVFEKEGKYYLVVGSRTGDTSGSILLYSSEDYIHWNYEGIVDKCNDEYGKMWECPDYFELDGKQVILTSPQDMQPDGLEFHAGNGTVALIGEGDGLLQFNRQAVQAIDYGIDFYAPQTLLTDDGRRIMIGWMQNWDTCNQWHEDRTFYGQMTLPRELSVKDGRLYQSPVREIENYYDGMISYDDINVKGKTSLDGIDGRIFDMTVTIKPQENFCWLKLNLAEDDRYATCIKYDKTEGKVRIDRSRSYSRRDIVSVREFLVEPEQGTITLRIIMDKNAIELFVNDGKYASSTMINTPLSADKISFESYGDVKLDIVRHDIHI